ncbi:hypothetical protein SHL15_0363 [Streptomyces hygroscopicus subsp. limoneus]|nr:hypothetical protein SHL15_0363 [Streptomyces hygroscopicus subsp. limoneus]
MPVPRSVPWASATAGALLRCAADSAVDAAGRAGPARTMARQPVRPSVSLPALRHRATGV